MEITQRVREKMHALGIRDERYIDKIVRKGIPVQSPTHRHPLDHPETVPPSVLVSMHNYRLRFVRDHDNKVIVIDLYADNM